MSKLIKVVRGRACLDGVRTVTCPSLPPVAVAIVRDGAVYHGIPLVQAVPSEEWEDEFDVRQIDAERVRVDQPGVTTLEEAEKRSQEWANKRVLEILEASVAGLEVQ